MPVGSSIDLFPTEVLWFTVFETGERAAAQFRDTASGEAGQMMHIAPQTQHPANSPGGCLRSSADLVPGDDA